MRYRFCVSWLTAIGLSLVTSSKPIDAAVFGDGNPHNGIEDQRRISTRIEARAIGTVFCDGGLRGTATHINPAAEPQRSAPTPALIITAAHILFDEDSGEMYQSCSYLPKNNRFEAIPFAAVSDHQFRPLAANKIHQSEADIVFVALAKPPRQPALQLAEPRLSNAQEVDQKDRQSQPLYLIGYNSSLDQITESAGCIAFNSTQFASEKLLFHDCDARAGASGGAVLQDQLGRTAGNEARLVAVHGGTLFITAAKAAHAPPAETDGAKVDPEVRINQARRIDQALIKRLQQFVAYLARDFPDQK